MASIGKYLGCLVPLGMIIVSIGYAIIPTIIQLAYQLFKTGKVPSLHNVKDVLFKYQWQIIGARANKTYKGDKSAMYQRARGVCVEVGAGTGHLVDAYDVQNVTKVYAVEPNVELHAALRERADSLPIGKKYEIVGCGMEDSVTLKKHGLSAGCADTVLSLSVLCGVPKPTETIQAMQDLLKPGGQFLFFEHVKSHDPTIAVVQDMYQKVWPHLFNGCNINRPTDDWLLNMSGWSSDKPKIEYATGLSEYSCIPSYKGVLLRQ